MPKRLPNGTKASTSSNGSAASARHAFLRQHTLHWRLTSNATLAAALLRYGASFEPEAFLFSPGVLNTNMLLTKSAESVSIVREWLELGLADPTAFCDSDPQDQTILGLLLYRRAVPLIDPCCCGRCTEHPEAAGACAHVPLTHSNGEKALDYFFAAVANRSPSTLVSSRVPAVQLPIARRWYWRARIAGPPELAVWARVVRPLPQSDAIAALNTQLYCSGVEEMKCALPNGARQLAGQCHWLMAPSSNASSRGSHWGSAETGRHGSAHGTRGEGTGNRDGSGDLGDSIDLASDWRGVTADELRRHSGRAPRVRDWFAFQHFDPTRSEPAFAHYRPASAGACLHGKRLLLLGDSTTRDTFYELLAVLGHAIFHWTPAKAMAALSFPSTSLAPPTRMTSGGKDRYGRCVVSEALQTTCVREVRLRAVLNAAPLGSAANSSTQEQGSRHMHDGGSSTPGTPAEQTLGGDGRPAPTLSVAEANASDTAETVVGYQLLTSTATWQLRLLHRKLLRPQRVRWDAAFIQCPTHPEPISSGALGNRSLTRAERDAVDEAKMRQIGVACRQLFDLVARHSPHARLYLLGPSGGADARGGAPILDRRLVQSIHANLGLACEVETGRGPRRYSAVAAAGIVPIDRFNVWGARKPDAMHPYFTAQLGLVNLMLNHFCRV